MMMNVMNCVLWLSFGYLNFDYYIMFGNSIGLFLNLIYLCFYFYIRFNRVPYIYLILSFVCILFSAGLFVLLSFVLKKEELAKYLAMFFNIFMYAAPGQMIVFK